MILFLCGDVMTGRGIDQVLPHPGDPRIFEPYMQSARGYVELAEAVNGPIPRPVSFSYVWGDALAEQERIVPDVRIVNLETSITTSNDHWPGKEIQYRMNPANISVITSAGIDVCSLANNHVLDWGYAGLAETVETLRSAGIRGVGARGSMADAEAPAVLALEGRGRVIVFSFGAESSGIPASWGAGKERPGVNLLPDLSTGTVRRVGGKVGAVKRTGDIVVASIHWGENWGYGIAREQVEFAHGLIDEGGVDVVHGHSSHHVKGIEVYRGKPVIYGCGDFINDYEGIGGYTRYRGDLGLMYFVEMDQATGTLTALRMVPTRMEKFRVNRASPPDAAWLGDVLCREGKQFGTRVEPDRNGSLLLHRD